MKQSEECDLNQYEIAFIKYLENAQLIILPDGINCSAITNCIICKLREENTCHKYHIINSIKEKKMIPWMFI
jgi:hypothetical protein